MISMDEGGRSAFWSAKEGALGINMKNNLNIIRAMKKDFCHGQNGDPEDLPELKPETLRTVRGLRPQPPDLRRPKALKLKSDSQRFLIIREGHEGTGMLPDTTLSNQEIRDVIAYLATLRAADKAMSK